MATSVMPPFPISPTAINMAESVPKAIVEKQPKTVKLSPPSPSTVNGGKVISDAKDPMEMADSFQMPSFDISSMIRNKMSMFTGILGSLGSMMGGGKGGRCKPKCARKKPMYGGGMKMKVMPGLGDKYAEKEVKKYVDEQTLAMLLMKAMSSSGKIIIY